jgi:hypothetical protein
MSIAGTVALNPSTNGPTTFTLNSGAASATLTLSNTTPFSGTGTFTPNGASATVIYSGANQAINVVNYTNLTVNGSGTATGAVSSVTGALVVGGSVTWTNSQIGLTITSVTLSGTASYTQGAVATITGDLTIGSGTTFTSCGSCTFTVQGATSISGTYANPNLAANKTFTGSVTVNSGGSITNAGNSGFIFQGGFTNNSSGTVSFGTGTVTFNTNSQSIAGSQNITFGGNVTLSGAITVTNNNSATVTITGPLDGSSGPTWQQGSGSYLILANNGSVFATSGTLDASTNASNTIEYSGGSSTVIANTTYGNLKISGTLSTGTQTGTVGGVFTVNGTFTPSGGTVTFNNGSSIVNSGSLTFNSMTIASSATVSVTTGTFTVGGTFTANSGSTVNWNNTSDVTILGGVTYVNLGVGRSSDSSPVNYTLGGNITVSGDLTVGNAGSTAADTLVGSNKTITLSGTDGTPFTLTPTWGAFSSGTSTVSFTGNNASGNTTVPVATYATLTLNNGSETFNLNGDITATALTITAGTLDTTTNNPNITVNSGTGGLTVNGTISGSGTGTIQVNGQSPFTGSGTVNLTGGIVEMRGDGLSNILFGSNSGSSTWRFHMLIFSNANSTTAHSYRTSGTGVGQIIVGSLVQIGKESDSQNTTLDNETNDRILTFWGNVVITSKGVLQASSTSACTVDGDWTNNGTFTANTGTMVFDGDSQAFTGDTTFYALALTSIQPRTVTFAGGSTISIADNGSLEFSGVQANEFLTLQSSNSTPWNLQVSTIGTTVSVSYVNVSRSNASGYKQIDASNGTNTNGGNNTNWLFIMPGSAPQSEFNGGVTIQGGTQIGN